MKLYLITLNKYSFIVNKKSGEIHIEDCHLAKRIKSSHLIKVENYVQAKNLNLGDLTTYNCGYCLGGSFKKQF